MSDIPTSKVDNTQTATELGLLRLHEAVQKREPKRTEATLSPEVLLTRFRDADPTRNGACLPWLLRTYASGGYRLEDLTRARETLATFVRLCQQLPTSAVIDQEIRNPRKLGSHTTLASLWVAIAPLVEDERLAKDGKPVDMDKEDALEQSRVLLRSDRVVIVVPMTKKASCWWGQGTQWCTAARKNNAFEKYYKDSPLIIICLRKIGNLPARKLQLHVNANDIHFMDENDARVSPELILERWQDLKALVNWMTTQNGMAMRYVPEHLRTEEMCLAAVTQDYTELKYVPKHLQTSILCTIAVTKKPLALEYVPDHLRTEAICTVAVSGDGQALEYVPKPLRTEAICMIAVKSNGWSLRYVPEPLRTEAICTTAVGSSAMALQYVPEYLRTETICSAAVNQNGFALKHVPEPLRIEAVCVAAVGSNGQALAYVPEPLRTEAICTVAVGRNGRALDYVPEPLRTEAMYLTEVGRHGATLYYVPKSLRTEAICLAAVGRDGMALAYVPEYLCTEAVCLAAVTQNGQALFHVPEPLRTKAVCSTAVGRDGRLLGHVPKHLRTKVLCIAAVGNNGLALRYVPEHLRTEKLRMVAVKQSGQDSIENILTEDMCDITSEFDRYELHSYNNDDKIISVQARPDLLLKHGSMLNELECLIKNHEYGLMTSDHIKDTQTILNNTPVFYNSL